MTDDLQSMRRQLAETEENLRLIQERKAEHILTTDVPLQLIKEERRLRSQTADLRERLEMCQEQLEQLYEQLEAAVAQEEWAKVRSLSERIQALDASYLDVPQWVAQARKRLQRPTRGAVSGRTWIVGIVLLVTLLIVLNRLRVSLRGPKGLTPTPDVTTATAPLARPWTVTVTSTTTAMRTLTPTGTPTQTPTPTLISALTHMITATSLPEITLLWPINTMYVGDRAELTWEWTGSLADLGPDAVFVIRWDEESQGPPGSKVWCTEIMRPGESWCPDRKWKVDFTDCDSYRERIIAWNVTVALVNWETRAYEKILAASKTAYFRVQTSINQCAP